MVRREVARIDLDAVGEAADARLVGGLQGGDELLGRLLDEPKLALMLPLRSSNITTVIGWTSFANSVSSCRLPLS